MSINCAAVDRLIDSMSFTQKVGQLNQRLLGWKSVERNAAGRLVASDELKQEIDRWGGLGTLYGLLRADPWSGQHWGNGIRLRSGLRRLRGAANCAGTWRARHRRIT